MDKYLLLLLKEVSTIIIPDLGALTITNQVTGEIMFMPYLKYDDGKLALYISEKEGFELNDAKNLISKYVRDVQAVLARGESYDMFQFGSFYKDHTGNILFRNWDGSLPSEAKEENKNDAEIHVQEVKNEDLELIKNEPNTAENVQSDKIEISTSKYNNEISGITINDEKDIEIVIGANHKLALRTTGKMEVLKDNIQVHNLNNFSELKENNSKSIETEIKIKEEVKEEVKEEIIQPITQPTVSKSKPELTAEEQEAKRLKNAAKEADRERRLAERMEKLAMKGLPQEEVLVTNDTPPNEESKKELPKKEEVKSKKVKEEKVNETKRAFVVQKTANQKSSIILASVILGIGILGGLFFILFNGRDIVPAPVSYEPKELAANNKNLNGDKEEFNSNDIDENTSTEVIETTDQTTIEEPKKEIIAEEKKVVKQIEKKLKTTTPQPVSEPIKTTSNITNGKYHVIGGSFSIESNANKFVRQMISKGIDAKLLGKINQMYIVSVGNYATQRQALSDRKVKHLKGWIYRQK